MENFQPPDIGKMESTDNNDHSNKFGAIDNENLKCSFCSYEGKNKASLSAHSRNCKSNLKNKKDEINEPMIIIIDNENKIQPILKTDNKIIKSKK